MKVPHPVSPLFVPTQSSSTLKGGSYELKGGSGLKKIKCLEKMDLNGTLLCSANCADSSITAELYNFPL